PRACAPGGFANQSGTGHPGNRYVCEPVNGSVGMRVKVHAIGFTELGNHDQWRKRVEVVVERSLTASHLERKRTVGAYLLDARIVGCDCPVEISAVVRRDSDRGQ